MTEQLPHGTAQRIDLRALNLQREAGWPDIHPEDYCHRCGNRNISWWVDSNIWLAVMDTAFSPHHGIICPSCFGALFATIWPDTSWELRLSTDTRGAKAFLKHTPDAQLITYIGISGHTENVIADFELGTGRMRAKHPYGLRRAIWDTAYGYVSGFRKRDIAYYVLTRSLNVHINRATVRHETRHVDRATCPHDLQGPLGQSQICYDCGATVANPLA